MRERSGLTYNPTTRSWQRRPGVRVQGWEGLATRDRDGRRGIVNAGAGKTIRLIGLSQRKH